MPSKKFTELKGAYEEAITGYLDKELKKQKVEKYEALSLNEKINQLANQERKVQLSAVSSFINSLIIGSDTDADHLLIFINTITSSIKEAMFLGYSNLKDKLSSCVESNMPKDSVSQAALYVSFMNFMKEHPAQLNACFGESKAIHTDFVSEFKSLYKEAINQKVLSDFAALDNALAPKAPKVSLADHSVLAKKVEDSKAPEETATKTNTPA